MTKRRPIHAPVTRPDPHRAPLRAGGYPGRPWKGDHALVGHAYRGNAVAVKLLLGVGANPNGNGGTRAAPLNLAAAGGHTVVTRLLLAAGADPNATDSAGNTPLESTRYPSRAKIHELLQAAAARTPQNAPG